MQEKLVERAKKGDAEAYAQLFSQYKVNIRLFLHVLALRKHVKNKSFVVTYLQK